MSFKPFAKSIVGTELSDCSKSESPCVIHCWASWSHLDREMDSVVRELVPRLTGWIEFYSCEIDLLENHEWLLSMKIVTVPSLVILTPGRNPVLIAGCRPSIEIAAAILGELASCDYIDPNAWKDRSKLIP